MSGQEIKDKINFNNKIIEENSNPSTFVLNKKVSKAIAENKQLRQICKHEYDSTNHCIYCGKEQQ